jgi:catechol 2,3-dioxygenase-like lactoylglutathione lyase family enzyme
MRLLRIGNGPTIEMFEIHHARQDHTAALNDLGWTHVALYVDNIDLACARFAAAGGTLLSSPHALAGVEAGAHNRGVYGRTPWGSLVELVTYPDGIQNQNPRLTRWTPQR